jgi:hypothetical protein
MACACTLMAVTAAGAHHGTATSYDQDAWITVTGVVTEYRWRNPHSSLHLEVTDAAGKTSPFAIELASPGLMARQGSGWTRNTFKAGDKVSFRVHPSKIGAPVGECLFNCEVTINGTRLANSNPAREGGPRSGGEEKQP